jgi:hypothetical protein
VIFLGASVLGCKLFPVSRFIMTLTEALKGMTQIISGRLT